MGHLGTNKWGAFALGLNLALNAGAASPEPVTQCRVLLNHVLTNAPVRLLGIDESQIVNLDAAGLHKTEPLMVWHMPGIQLGTSFETQLHRTLDLAVETAIANSATPNLLRDNPQHLADLRAVKRYLSIYARAYTDPHTGFVDFRRSLSPAAQDEFKALQKEAEIELAYAERGLKFVGTYSITRNSVIPTFRIGAVTIPWQFRFTPSREHRGFDFVVQSTKRSDGSVSDRLQNRIFLGKLRDMVFGDNAVKLASSHRYQYVREGDPQKPSALHFFNALHALEERGVSRINVDHMARNLVMQINLQMMKYFCGVARLCENMGLEFPHQVRRISKSAESDLVPNGDGTYAYTQNEVWADQLFLQLTETHYKKGNFRSYQFMGWKDFKEYAKTMDKAFDEDKWNAAIPHFMTTQGTPAREGTILNFTTQDTLLAGRVQAEWLNLNYFTRAGLFTDRLTLASVPVDTLALQLKPAALSHESGDLADAHVKLLLGRLQELLAEQTNQPSPPEQ